MTRITITLEFDEENLGPKWMNPDNMKSLLYTKVHTNEELLKIIAYDEGILGPDTCE
jgi:hypothetical protein